MKSYPGWQYNEMKQVGTDYNDPAQVEIYDSQMGKLRDIKKENEEIIKALNLTNDQTLIEFGTGTGNFAIDAAKHCKKVFAVDVSPRMLEFAQKKADMNGIKNIELLNAGFLTYEHSGAPADAVVSQLALHHLPDFWKLIALKRVFGILKNGGKFFLKDTVYSFDENTHEAFFNNLIEIIRKAGGMQIANDLETGIRDEYSTLGWIMEALLLRAGFTIHEKQYSEGLIAVYLCTKEK
ncbi:MAG: class I SAM-dependent methyltransferase [Candidatus Methanoperedens sp.]|nr:class I SAM-dependent methyltransferase [Candidatus Methanoperedens sp.]